MHSKGVKSYLAGFCVSALLAGSLAAPPAAFGEAHKDSSEGTSTEMKEGEHGEQQKGMNATKGDEHEQEGKQQMEQQGEGENGSG